ncbi:rhodanese-like domain-containing protein [Terrimonas pollutisoli]|uniref:rhodanese-like domain-containing protein n=1 Tax=Terrimonas pollutisoli TaxID=3034147 RepID=UPI0034DE69D9
MVLSSRCSLWFHFLYKRMGSKWRAVKKSREISLEEFKPLYENNGIRLMDLRGEAEYSRSHIKEAQNVLSGLFFTILTRSVRIKKWLFIARVETRPPWVTRCW